MPSSDIPAETDNKCDQCKKSICCNYITQSLDTPRSKADFQHLIWQISHENISIYKDSDGWFLLVETRCEHLQDNGRCGIYDRRPQICREYDNDYCEYDAPAESGFDLYFRTYKELRAYCRKRFKTWEI